MSEKEHLEKLRDENRRLRRENEYLRHRLAMEDRSPSEKLFAQRLKQKSALRAKTYFGYLIERFRTSRPFLIYDKTRFAVRGLFFITKLWTLLTWLFAFLGLGAQFLLTVGALTVFLPAALLSSAILGVYGFFAHKKRNAFFEAHLASKPDETIYFFFVPKSVRASRFLHRISGFPCKGTVFLVSFSFRGCGPSGVIRADETIYIIHVSYYFSLVKRLTQKRIVKIF